MSSKKKLDMVEGCRDQGSEGRAETQGPLRLLWLRWTENHSILTSVDPRHKPQTLNLQP